MAYENKKPVPAYLKYRSTNLKIGFITALSLMIMAFNWTSSKENIAERDQETFDEFTETVPQTFIEKKKPIVVPVIRETPSNRMDFTLVISEEPIIEAEDTIAFVEEEDPLEEIIEEIGGGDVEVVVENKIFERVEQMPEFPGGELGLRRFLAKVTYPRMAKENDIEGTVHVRFVIEKNGSVSSIEVLKSPDDLLSNAAIKRMKVMPVWKPGMQRMEPVRVSFVVPFKFRLS